MPLPNTPMDFTAFDTLTAAQMDDIVENIEALADGSGLDVSSVTPEKLLADTGTTWPWIAWTPTWTNLTIGTATVDAKFKQIGKTVDFRIAVTLNGTSVGTAPVFTLPVPSVTVSAAMANMPLGTANGNTGGGAKNMWLKWASTTTCRIMVWDANNDEGNMTATNPFTWSNGHTLIGEGRYEAA